MGLNATVYKRRDEVPIPASDMRFVRIDERTGQWDFSNRDAYERWHDQVMAVSKRLGHIALIDLLREETARILAESPEPVLIRKVLYDGTHVGDVVTGSDLTTIKEEITSCREHLRHSTGHLARFLDDM